MSGSDFQITNWGWRWQQLQQQAGEWIELKWSQLAPKAAHNLPDSPDLSWLGDLSWLLKVVGIVLVAIALWQLVKLVEQLWNRGVFRTPARSSHLPAQEQPTVKDWLAQARQQQSRGDYRATCRCLYMAMLQRLNDTQIVSNQPSLTDGEYRQLLHQQPRHPAYDVLLETHEQLHFGEREATPETVRRCQEAYREIEENR
jgi:hypothetical protein